MKKASIQHGACAVAAYSALVFTLAVCSVFSPLFTIATAHAQQTITIQKTSAAPANANAGSGLISNPISLVIPKIAVVAPIKAMGLTPSDSMAVPNNFTDVGWYANGVEPGNIGNAVLGAHVDNGTYNPTKNGVFKNLHTLTAGDDIYVVDSNGATEHFKVTAISIYPYNSTDTSAVFGPTDAAHLNIITCYGTWKPAIGTYSERLVVFATLISDKS